MRLWPFRRQAAPQQRGLTQREIDAIAATITSALPEKIVNSRQAFENVATVFRCVKVIMRSACVPIVAVDESGNEITHAAFSQWAAAPHPGLDWSRWLQAVIGRVVLSGGCRLLLHKDNPLVMLPLSLDECRVEHEGGQAVFPPKRYRVNGVELVPAERVIEILDPDPLDMFDSTSAVEASIIAARTDHLAALHTHNTLQNGALIPAVYRLKRAFASPEQFQEFLLKFRDMFATARRSGTIPVMDANFEGEIQALGFKITDLALPELARAAKEDVAKALGVPPALIGDSESRYANFKEQRITFLEDTLRPLWRLLESAFNARVVPLLGGGFTVKLRETDSYVVRQLWQESAASLASAVGRVLTVNEAREKLGLPSFGPAGDRLERPFTVATFGAEAELQIEAESRVTRAARLLLPLVRQSELSLNGRTVQQRIAYWRVVDATARGFEERYRSAFVRLLTALKEALKDSARAHWETEQSVPYDREQFDERALQRRLSLLPAIWREGANIAQDEIGDLTGERLHRTDAVSAAAFQTIRKRALHWTQLTGDSIFAEIDETLVKAIKDGLTLQRLITRLDELAALQPERAERIARTEVISSLNAGKLSAYADSGEVRAKEWLATKDDRVRGADPDDEFDHLAADGQVVLLDEPFVVSGERLQYPGDPDQSSPGNTINCRCSVLPVLTLEG